MTTTNTSRNLIRFRCGAFGVAAAIALLGAAPALAQNQGLTAVREAVAEVSEIVVKGQAQRRDNTAFSTTTIGNRTIVEGRVVEIEEMFRDVPGMNVRAYGLPGVANQIVLRGFGNGGHGGDIGFVIDGIPLNEANSHADGYVDTNVLVPLEIQSLRVYRGPVSALYGNFNRAGLIAFETRKGGDYTEADMSGGSYGAYDAQVALGRSVGGGELNAAGQYFRSDGFRPQSEAERVTLAGRYSFKLSDDLDVAISTRLHAAEAGNAAYLIPAQFAVDPYGIDPRTMNDGSQKRFATLRGDINYTIAPDLRLLTYLYGTRQDFTRWFTRGAATANAPWRQREETYDREVYGVGANLNGRVSLDGRELNYVAGIEGFSESTDFQFYDDLINRRRINAAVSDRNSDIRTISLFSEATWAAHRLLDLQLGFRLDRFRGTCKILGPESGADPCSNLESTTDFSPKIGGRSQVASWLGLRASYAQGVALPDGFVKYAPGAQALDPNKFEQIDLGARVTLDRLMFDIVGYLATSKQEIRQVQPGQFENLGATRRTGVELGVTLGVTDTLEFQGVYAYADSEITENATVAMIGNRVAGVPDHTATLNVAWTPVPSVRLDAGYRYLGAYQANAANSEQSASFGVYDIGVSYAFDTSSPVRVYADIENVGDRAYASSYSATRAPGSPRIFRVGLQVGF